MCGRVIQSSGPLRLPIVSGLGVAILVLAIVLALPIPFANWLPACAIAIIGLAIVEKDGAAVVVGLGIGVLSLIVAGTVVIGLIKALILLSGIIA